MVAIALGGAESYCGVLRRLPDWYQDSSYGHFLPECSSHGIDALVHSEDLSRVNRTRRLIYPDKRQNSLRLLMYHISSAKCCFFRTILVRFLT